MLNSGEISTLKFSFVRPVYADSLYDRVLKSGKIRAGYICYQPTLMRDMNTKKFSGIGFEVLELAARKLSLNRFFPERFE